MGLVVAGQCSLQALEREAAGAVERRGSHGCDHVGQRLGFAASKRCRVVFRLSPGCGEEENPKPECLSGWRLFLDRGCISLLRPSH